jgi:hypothetical protein
MEKALLGCGLTARISRPADGGAAVRRRKARTLRGRSPRFRRSAACGVGRRGGVAHGRTAHADRAMGRARADRRAGATDRSPVAAAGWAARAGRWNGAGGSPSGTPPTAPLWPPPGGRHRRGHAAGAGGSPCGGHGLIPCGHRQAGGTATDPGAPTHPRGHRRAGGTGQVCHDDRRRPTARISRPAERRLRRHRRSAHI